MHHKSSLMNCIARLLLLSTLILLGTATSAQPAIGVLWEVKSATNTAYAYGSIHIAKADFYPLPAAVEAAYRQANTLVVEVDTTDPSAAAKAMPLLTYAAPDKLERHLSKRTWRSLKAATGAAAEQFQSLRPAMLVTAFTLQVFSRQGFDPKYGIDLHFMKQAKADQKKLVELESVEFQAGVLGGLNDADGDAMLERTLLEMRSGALQREAEAMIAAWKAGNAKALAEVLRDAANKDAGSKRIMKLLMDDRNIGMTQKIVRLLEAGDKIFVVVGAGHLVGANSVIDLLRKQGLQVRQIK